MEPRPCYIYGLVDPRTGAIEYVGRSIDPERRLKQHWQRRRSARDSRAAWFRDMLADDTTPELVILEASSEDIAGPIETRWIKHYQRQGQARANTIDITEWPPPDRTRPIVMLLPPAVKPRPTMSAEQLRHFRREQALSQQAIADVCGVSVPAVSRWERGNRPIPQYAILALMDRLGYTPPS